tara:strand:+ start:18529 stop:20973 length:2445 start_codon:yes stop_codon:yes gene_type:complete
MSICIYTFSYSDKIKEITLNKINSKLNQKISLSEINFSLLDYFPHASVSFSNLLVLDSYVESNDTLIYADKASVKINLYNLIRNNFSLSNIRFEKAKIFIKYNSVGSPNFDIFNESSDNNNIILEEIDLYETKVKYIHIKDSVDIFYNAKNMNLEFSNMNETIDVISIGKMNKCIVSEINYISNKKIELNTRIDLLNNNLNLTSEVINLDDVKFHDVSFSKFSEKWNLNTKIIEEEIEDIINITPNKLKDIYYGHKMKGFISGTINLENDSKSKYPFCNIDFNIKNSQYEYQEKYFELNKISTNGNLTNGKSRNFTTTTITFNDFKSKKENGFINGFFIISNLNKYFIKSDFNSSWELSELNEFIENSNFKNLNGNVNGRILYEGNFSFDSSMKNYFKHSNHSGKLIFNDVSFNYKNSDLNFSTEEMKWVINNQLIELNNIFNVSKSDFNFNGKINNLLTYILEEDKEIFIEGKINSENLDFEELLKISDLSEGDDGEDFTSVLPNWIDVKIDLYSKTFKYKKFIAKDFNGKIEYENEKLKLSSNKIDMNTLNGDISIDFDYYENRQHDLVLKSNIQCNKIDISDAFNSFDNFNQDDITHTNIKGKATANIYLQCMWDKNYKFYKPSLHLNSHLQLYDGQLINFEPMYELSDYISIKELKNIRFAKLENKIRIENEKIIIPEMDINSSAISLHISGEHSFDNIMDFKVRLLLSDILSKKSKNKSNINIKNFSVDNSGKTTIQLKMKGPIDDPKISLDKLKIKNNIINEIKKESNEVKEIIEEKLLNKPKIENIDNTDDDKEEEFEIEWEDEKIN